MPLRFQTPECGYGLEGVLQHRQASVHGILNGIDIESWNPATDPQLPAYYDRDTFAEGKAACKRALQQECGLPQQGDVPLCGMISRMTSQKGFDLISEIVPELLATNIQFVFLGTGEAQYEEFVRELVDSHPTQVAAHIGFDEGLAHRVEAGADIFLMPSQFEPCGLNQMYSQRYGTIPVVSSVGGLVDSVIDHTPKTSVQGTATGFHFGEYTAAAFLKRLREAIAVYHQPPAWKQLIRAAMSADWSWKRSAAQYEDVYHQAQNSLTRPRDVPPRSMRPHHA